MKQIYFFIALVSICAATACAPNIPTATSTSARQAPSLTPSSAPISAPIIATPRPTLTPLITPTSFLTSTATAKPGLQLVQEFSDHTLGLAASADGKWLAWTVTKDTSDPQTKYQGIGAYNVETKNFIHQDIHPSVSVAFEPYGKYLAIGTQDSHLYRWDYQTDEMLPGLTGASGEIVSIAFSTDGKWVAAGTQGRFQGGDGSVILWQVGVPDAPKILPSYGAVSRVGFAPNSHTLYFSTLASSCSRGGGGVFIWDGISPDPQQVFNTNGNPVLDLAIHPQGKYIASVGATGPDRCIGKTVVSLWDVSNGQLARVFSPTTESSGKPSEPAYASSISFSPDGKWLAIATQVGQVQVWDWQNKTLKYTGDTHPGQGQVGAGVVFMQNDLVAFSANNTVSGDLQIFRLPP